MSKLIVTDTDEQRLQATAQAVENALSEQRKKETIQSLITALMGITVVLAVLAVIALIPTRRESPTIITYNAPLEEEEPKLQKKEMTNNVQPRPPGASSSMAKVIAASTPSAVSVPITEITIPDAMLGMEDDFGPGFGSDEGEGSGGGGATFFGGKVRGQRIVYVIDFSGSMTSSSGGGSRIEALKKELERSIKELSSDMEVSLVFFSSTAWTFATPGPNPHDQGWSGVGKMPVAAWYPATAKVKQELTSKMRAMPTGGGTVWYPPLKLALNMNPPPQGVFLLSDGAPRDADLVLDEMKEINPHRIPVHTISLELPGSPAGQLLEIAEKTGGKFSMIYKGKLYKGRAAQEYTLGTYDEE